MKTGVAIRPITDMKAYRDQLGSFVYRSGTVMQPVFAAAAEITKRVCYAEGEDDRVLRAAQVVIDEKLARPILVGRAHVIEQKLRELGLHIEAGRDFEVADFDDDAMIGQAAELYYQLRRRGGLARNYAVAEMRRNSTLIGAALVRQGKADGMLCGTSGPYAAHLGYVADVIGLQEGTRTLAAMNLLMLPGHTLFICDTAINPDPTAEQIAEMTLLAAEAVERFGIKPKVALLSHSSFGATDTPSARKMRAALALVVANRPDLEVEGEMHADAALSEEIRDRIFPNSRLKGQANLLVLPDLDAANIAFNLVKVIADGLAVGPMLIGVNQPAHILTPSVTVRGIVNMTAVAVVEAQGRPDGWMDARSEAAPQPGARR
jgi:malate dehydrogenase (oxaloacetate-decarboxylating)(NADP+)